MSYTMTFDASHKVTKQGGHSATFVKHIGRDVDLQNGVEQAHGNKGIVSARTPHNVTMVNDGAGGYSRAQSTGEMMAAVERRLADVKPQTLKNGQPKATRKDAVVIRPFILQLDPEWFEDNCPDWRTTGDIGDEGRRLVGESLAWCESEFGQQNIAFTSLHLDEYSPQLQVGFVPVTDDGRLNQGEFFSGKVALAQMHTRLRDHMASAGYDVTKERTTKDRTIKAMGTAEYKQYREELDDASALVDEMIEKKKIVDAREVAVSAREAAAAAREHEAQLTLESAVESRVALEEERVTLQGKLGRVSGLVEELQSDVEDLRETPAKFERFLDARLEGGATLRPAYDRFDVVVDDAKKKRLARLRAQAQASIDATDQVADSDTPFLR